MIHTKRQKRKKVKNIPFTYESKKIPVILEPYYQLEYALDNGYLSNESLVELPFGDELPLEKNMGNGTFHLYRIYPGVRALVFSEQVGKKKYIRKVKFFRSMSINTVNGGIQNVSIFGSFEKLNKLFHLKAGDVLSINAKIKSKISKGKKYHNIDLTLLESDAKTYGRIIVSPYPKKGKVVGLNNPDTQGGSIIKLLS